MTQAVRVALVTGAGTGVGKAAALAMLRDGYKVALAGRRREPLELVAKESGHAALDAATPLEKTLTGGIVSHGADYRIQIEFRARFGSKSRLLRGAPLIFCCG